MKSPLRLAVIVPVYNEEDLVSQFLDHYSPQVDRVFLLDNESTDGSLSCAMRYPNVEVSTFKTGGQMKDLDLIRVKRAKLTELRGRFDYAILIDADEFLVPKRGGTIREALGALPPAEIHGTHGLTMMRRPPDAPYEPSIPLVQQYRYGVEDVAHLSKPIIVRPESDVAFHPGHHMTVNKDNAALKDPARASFYLLHYSLIDEEIYVRRAMGRASRMSEENRRLHLSHHYFDPNEAAYRERFHRETANPRAVQLAI